MAPGPSAGWRRRDAAWASAVLRAGSPYRIPKVEVVIRSPALLFSALFLLTGCKDVVTLNQMFPDSVAVTDDRVLGTWRGIAGDNDTGFVTIAKAGGPNYLISSTEDSTPVGYYGRFARVNGQFVLDLASADSSSYEAVLGKAWPVVLTHTLYLLTIAQDTIMVTSHSSDSVVAAFRRGRVRLPYTVLPKGDLVVGGSTDELWRALPRFLALHLKTDDPYALVRVAAP